MSTISAGPVVVLPTTGVVFMSIPNEGGVALPTNESQDPLDRMPREFSDALPTNEGRLMRMPNEVLAEIARFCVTPFSDIEPLWTTDTYSDLHALTLVNRRFRDVCQSLRLLSHLRLWVPEPSLQSRLRMLQTDKVVAPREGMRHLLLACRSLSIRTIGPLQSIHPPDGLVPGAGLAGRPLRNSLRNTLISAANLTELRFATDNGGRTMEHIFGRILRPGEITFPNIKSLYLRTETSMASTFQCFPNLKAINFNIHCELTRSTELRVLGDMDSLRVLSILKHGRGWLVDDLSQHLAGRFPKVETLTLEGFVNMARYRYVPLKRMANLVDPDTVTALRKLVISDEPFIQLPELQPTSPTYFDLARRHARPREDIAVTFFKRLPNLREIVIARKCDFSAHVYHPIVRFEEPDESELTDENSTPVPKIGARLVHIYHPQDRRNVGYQYVSRPGNARWGQPYQSHGHRSEYVDHVDVEGEENWYYYPEMRLENCQTTPFDAEWLHTIRAKGF